MASRKRGQWEASNTLRAVVLADSFDTRFAPLTASTPRVLLPLVNTTLIDYTFEFLQSNGVHEIFVFCCVFAEQIKEHLADSRYTSETSTVTVHTLVSERCLSFGDALREIDRLDIIQDHFFLVGLL